LTEPSLLQLVNAFQQGELNYLGTSQVQNADASKKDEAQTAQLLQIEVFLNASHAVRALLNRSH